MRSPPAACECDYAGRPARRRGQHPPLWVRQHACLAHHMQLTYKKRRRERTAHHGEKGAKKGENREKEKWKKRKEKWGNSLDIPYELVTSPHQVWSILEISTAELTLTENGEQNLKGILWAEAVQTLVDAIVRAHKRNEEENS